MHASLQHVDKKRAGSQSFANFRNRAQSLVQSIKGPGVHSVSYMSAAGFKYIGNGDTARCMECGLEVSNWMPDMKPFAIHSNRQLNCPFVRSMVRVSLSNMSVSSSSSTTDVRKRSISNEQEYSSKREKIGTMESESVSDTLFESDLLQQVRRRTFSHWLHLTIPSSRQMIEAGFFSCNVGDRVICIYCNLICQQWTPFTDDPCEVHKTLSPQCLYVIAMLKSQQKTSAVTINRLSKNHDSLTLNSTDSFRCNEITYTAVCHTNFIDTSRRDASFATWPKEDLPSVDELVRAGFFYTGTKTIVTCFYCNGSLQSWGPNDNPMIEHARWFPHCAYAQQLCGENLYRKIQESKRVQQEHLKINELKEKEGDSDAVNTNLKTNSRQLLIPDEVTLSRLVAARLELPISQRLLDQNFKLSIIKRCWEDQLRLKHNDFVSKYDLYTACVILQKQINHIDGKKENITVPSIKMKEFKEQNGTCVREQTSILPNADKLVSNPADVEMTTSSQSTTGGNEYKKQIAKQSIAANNQNQSISAAPHNPCVLCLTEEKRLACIPCGHLATCVTCGQSLRSCPICRREIEAFVRLYL
ncbi:unnamed protein product [Rotaria sp. Silwood1]|nr:unnamed protein product [Rotaria sp. Silwood1]